jgi:hypothetical protein
MPAASPAGDAIALTLDLSAHDIPEQLPRLTGKPHQLQLVERSEVRRTRIDRYSR